MLRRLRSCPSVAGLLAALLLSGCAGDAEPPKHLLRLWRDVEPAEVTTAGAMTSAGPDVVWSTSFDGTDGAKWYRAVAWGKDAITHRPVKPSGGALILEEGDALASVVLLDVEPGEALEIVATARSEGEGTSEPVVLMAAVEFKERFDPATRWTAGEIADLFNTERNASYLVTVVPEREPQNASVRLVVDQQTEVLALYFPVPLDGLPERLVVDRVAVTREPIDAYFARGGDVPRVERIESEWASAGPSVGPVRVQFDRDEREGLIALAGATYRYELEPSDVERRLDLALGLRESNSAARARFIVSLDGTRLIDEAHDAPTSIDEPAWHDRTITIPPSPARRQVLEFATEAVPGSRVPLTVFGHPTLHPRRVDAPKRPNVVLISLDTLRPDRLGAYGHGDAVTPHIDALANDGWTFTRAYSTSSYTLPSHGSMLTGLYPAYHGAVDVVDELDPEHTPFLARQLADAGYVTAAFTGGGYVGPSYGFGVGFDRYSLNDPVWAYDTLRGKTLIRTMSWRRVPMKMNLLRRYGEQTVTDFVAAQDADTPFFLFLHTFIVHNYAPNKRWLREFDLFDERGREEPFNHKAREAYNEGDEDVDPTDVYEQYMPYYDATISMADDFVGAVVEAVERAGLGDDTLILVTSDHGEEFGEHGVFGHGVTLYDSNTRVPLIARLPRSVREAHALAGAPGAGSEIDRLVSLVDLAPWILRTVGLEPDPRMETLGAAGDMPLGDSQPGRTRLFIELDTHVSRKSAVVRGASKLLTHSESDGELLDEEIVELYDIINDPAESFDRTRIDPALTRDLRAAISEHHDLGTLVNPRGVRAVDLDSIDPDKLENLRALGYLIGDEDDDGK